MKTAHPAPRLPGIGFRYLARGLVFAALAFSTASIATAADLGGNCCADLEDRIAELEATTARKGNHKISVTVYGTVDESIYHFGGDLGNKWAVGNNSNAETFVGFKGEAVVLPNLSVGYVLELGVDGGSQNPLGSPLAGSTNQDTYTRRSYAYVKSNTLGTVSVGEDYQSTHGVSQVSVANTVVAARMLSIRPIVGPQIGEALDLFDGGRAEIVRYDSPTFYGALVSASYAAGGIDGYQKTGDVWDVALKWAGESGGFRAAAAIGYREGIVIPTIGNIGSISSFGTNVVDPKTLSGSASIKHIATGLFLNGSAGRFDPGGVLGNASGDYTAWTVQGGIEQKWLPIGTTTLFGEYADSDLKNVDLGLKYWGLGAVQHVDAAVADFYVDYRKYDVDIFSTGLNGDVFMAGMKIDF